MESSGLGCRRMEGTYTRKQTISIHLSKQLIYLKKGKISNLKYQLKRKRGAQLVLREHFQIT